MFAETLKKVVDNIEGGIAAVIMGLDGIAVDTYIKLADRVDVNTVWKDGTWNTMRVRMEGEAPHMTLWINDTKMWEVAMPKNDQIGGLYGGMIGLQLHWSATYTAAAGGSGSGLPWSVQRFRNILVQELP